MLGVETSTLDASGEVTATHDMGVVPRRAGPSQAAAGLTGEILQVPPMVSAVKVDGRRLHELAREGVEVEREPRPVTVHRFAVEPTDDPAGRAGPRSSCSSGTYVRTLAADLGHALGGGAHLRDLRRTAVGSLHGGRGPPPGGGVPEVLLGPAEALRDYPAVVVDGDDAVAVGHGRVLERGRPLRGRRALAGGRRAVAGCSPCTGPTGERR